MPSPIDAAHAEQRRLATPGVIARYVYDHGTAPTYSELATLTGVTVKTIERDLAWLRDRGLITWDRNKPRTVRPTPKEPTP